MASQPVPPVAATTPQLTLTPYARFPGLRVLAWQGAYLYASRGYTLLRADVTAPEITWQYIGRYRPAWWRNLTASSRLSFRLCRDGFHALATLSTGDLVAAVPGAIIRLAPAGMEFQLSHLVLRGTRPLHIAVTPGDHIFWGEYFDNPRRDEVHIYASTDRGCHWNVAYTFPRGAIRHVHNIVYDRWEHCLWVLTGDNGTECRILRASCDFRQVEVVLSGHQQARAVALAPTPEALYFSSDTPLERNHVHRMDRRGNLREVATLPSSSIYGCRVGEAILFSTMVEPSTVNRQHAAGLFAGSDGYRWERLLHWEKDRWPMRWFQYGNVLLPDGNNTTAILALTTIAFRRADLETSLWLVNPA